MKKIVAFTIILTILTSTIFSANAVEITNNESKEQEICNHNWVEITEPEITHHDAEYTTRTYWWAGDYEFYGINIEFEENNMPLSKNRYSDSGLNSHGVLTNYDAIMYYYNYDWENVPNEDIYMWITIDNYQDYGLTYEEFIDQVPIYDGNNNKNPVFNPKYDVLVGISDKDNVYTNALAEFNMQTAGYQNLEMDVRKIGNFTPVEQEQVCTQEAWDEVVTHGRKCTICGEVENYDTHIHNWEEVEEIKHSDGLYKNKTYWMLNPGYYENIPKDAIKTENKYHYADWTDYVTDYDLLMWYYGSLENVNDPENGMILYDPIYDTDVDYSNGYNADGFEIGNLETNSWKDYKNGYIIDIDEFNCGKELGLGYFKFSKIANTTDALNNTLPQFNASSDHIIIVDQEAIQKAYDALNEKYNGELGEYNPKYIGSVNETGDYLPISQEIECYSEPEDRIYYHTKCSICNKYLDTAFDATINDSHWTNYSPSEVEHFNKNNETTDNYTYTFYFLVPNSWLKNENSKIIASTFLGENIELTPAPEIGENVFKLVTTISHEISFNSDNNKTIFTSLRGYQSVTPLNPTVENCPYDRSITGPFDSDTLETVFNNWIYVLNFNDTYVNENTGEKSYSGAWFSLDNYKNYEEYYGSYYLDSIEDNTCNKNHTYKFKGFSDNYSKAIFECTKNHDHTIEIDVGKYEGQYGGSEQEYIKYYFNTPNQKDFSGPLTYETGFTDGWKALTDYSGFYRTNKNYDYSEYYLTIGQTENDETGEEAYSFDFYYDKPNNVDSNTDTDTDTEINTKTDIGSDTEDIKDTDTTKTEAKYIFKEWSDDCSKAIFSNGTDIIEIESTKSSEVVKEPTCIEAGEQLDIYTVKYEGETYETSKIVEIPKLSADTIIDSDIINSDTDISIDINSDTDLNDINSDTDLNDSDSNIDTENIDKPIIDTIDTPDISDTDSSDDNDSDTDKSDTDESDTDIEPILLGLLGDVDGDYTVNSKDALIVLRASVGLERLNNAQLILADVDNSKFITSSDSLDILRYSVGLKDTHSIINTPIYLDDINPRI